MGKNSYKRELIEWAVIVGLGIGLYVTGLHTEVIGMLQRVVLSTGLIQPDTNDHNLAEADYDFLLRDVDNQQVNFRDFKGETVFLNFWATWCAPCIAEMPNIESLSQEIKDVKFVMISLDKDFEKAKKFKVAKDLSLSVYALDSNLPDIYNPSSIPTTYVLGPDGKIHLTNSGMANYNTDKFKAFLKDLVSSPNE